MKEFHNDMYEEYKMLRDKHTKITHTVNGPIANKTTLVFSAREGNSRLVNGIVGTDYTTGVPEDVYHSFQLVEEFKQPHANIRRKLKALKATTSFGTTSKATVITGSERRTKSEVEVLSKEQYDTLRMSLTISSSMLKPSNVYIIQGAGLTKIGISSNVGSRFKKLTTSSPVPLELVYNIEVSRARKIEKELHTKYDAERSHGEWFNLTEEQVQDTINYLKGLDTVK